MFLLLCNDLLFECRDAGPRLRLSGCQALFGGSYDGLDIDQIPEGIGDTGQHTVFKFLPADRLGIGADASVEAVEGQLLAAVCAAVAILP
ncbi:hypothetical protein OEG84_13255 [Hoeflea sp. G2-23]|uniref:Uncharacterized protein n=1 Tax=Hoeflea algicola TaxID=2983763 RepID=A0ABT3ZA40_9HYPH|nr:hypothetical protein [Hoeflea algicola]MCY0148545.1 hypothetical protein [Hoeflea algicola]MCY0148645.1 hypothetical protein [Hoeflea algicola]